jgi:hypothetical protein
MIHDLMRTMRITGFVMRIIVDITTTSLFCVITGMTDRETDMGKAMPMDMIRMIKSISTIKKIMVTEIMMINAAWIPLSEKNTVRDLKTI